MKCPQLIAAELIGALALANAQAQTAPKMKMKMKMTTDIPPEITTPDSVETRPGTLWLKDGFPDEATVQKVYDNLDFQRGMQAFPGRPRWRFATRFAASARTTRPSFFSSP